MLAEAMCSLFLDWSNAKFREFDNPPDSFAIQSYPQPVHRGIVRAEIDECSIVLCSSVNKRLMNKIFFLGYSACPITLSSKSGVGNDFNPDTYSFVINVPEAKRFISERDNIKVAVVDATNSGFYITNPNLSSITEPWGKENPTITEFELLNFPASSAVGQAFIVDDIEEGKFEKAFKQFHKSGVDVNSIRSFILSNGGLVVKTETNSYVIDLTLNNSFESIGKIDDGESAIRELMQVACGSLSKSSTGVKKLIEIVYQSSIAPSSLDFTCQ